MGILSDIKKSQPQPKPIPHSSSSPPSLTPSLPPQSASVGVEPPQKAEPAIEAPALEVPELKAPANGFRIAAVAGPDYPIDHSDLVFNPASTKLEREDAMDAINWGVTMEQREKNWNVENFRSIEVDLFDGIL